MTDHNQTPTSRKRVIVLGGGVIGLCSAYGLQQRGHEVVVLDRSPQKRDGCSFGNAGLIVPSHFVPLAAPGMIALGLKWLGHPESPFALRPRPSSAMLRWGWEFWRACAKDRADRAAPVLRDLNMASRQIYEEWADAWGNEFGLAREGLLMLCRSEHALAEEAGLVRKAADLGMPAEVLDSRGLASLDPSLQMNVAGGVFFPRDCHLSPARLLAGLERRILDGGGRIVWNADVQSPRVSGGGLTAVETTQGTFAGDEFVLAGGVWSDKFAEAVGLRLPLLAGKGYSLTLSAPRVKPRISLILVEARVAITPMGETLRFGGTMELGAADERVNPRRVRGIVKSIPSYLPDFREDDFAGVTPWSGLRPCSPDGLPYLGRTSRCRNLVVACGHAMMGLSLGPVTGQVVSQLISGEATPLAHPLLSPDRYG
jgi:D-amino-acid dehydrogenase